MSLQWERSRRLSTTLIIEGLAAPDHSFCAPSCLDEKPHRMGGVVGYWGAQLDQATLSPAQGFRSISPGGRHLPGWVQQEDVRDQCGGRDARQNDEGDGDDGGNGDPGCSLSRWTHWSGF